MPDFLQRLKQRKLVQWAIAYVAFAFALIQVLDVVADSYGWPRMAMHIVFGLLVLGFVVTLILAWYHGERGAQRISGPELLLIALALLIGGGLLWHFARAPTETSSTQTLAAARGPGAAQRNLGTGAPATAPTALSAATEAPASSAAFNPPADSIVVLPFANRSGDKSQQYFSDGITEELTSALGQNTGLSVIAWETASHYRDGTHTPAEIGKALNVAQILDGGIQRAGDEVRVSAELVSTVTGRQLWSSHYDATLKNIFAVQDQITGAIAGALKVKFAGMQAAPTQNPQAHEFYLKALAANNLGRLADAQTDFQQALKLDPNYADAWAGLAGVYVAMPQITTLPLQQALPEARAAANKALALDPRNAAAVTALATADFLAGDIAKAQAGVARALELDPNNAMAHLLYGAMLPLKQGLVQFKEAARLAPDSNATQNTLASNYADLRDWPAALRTYRTLNKVAPNPAGNALNLAYVYSQMQRDQQAVEVFDQLHPTTSFGKQYVAAFKLTYQARLQPALKPQALAAVDKLPGRTGAA
ncbi:MAG TPA: hypothetical protein VFE77_14650, partial [Rhodanobacter sp.]|nr:hypothetical protein [Rhodanobacter sp.]